MESQIRDFRYSPAIRTNELEKRIAHLEHLVGWLTGLIIDLVAIAFGIAAAIFVAGDYNRLSSVDGACVCGVRHGVSMSPRAGEVRRPNRKAANVGL